MAAEQESLQVIASRYRALLALAHDVIYVLDAAGNLLDINAAGEQLTGYRRAELLGRPVADLVLPEHLPIMRQMLERKIEGQPATTYTVEIQARDGRRVVLEVNTRLVYRDGRPIEIHGIARDITERQQARAQRGFLTDVSQVLNATLDDDAILEHIAALAVPRVADYCIVDIIEPGGRLRRAAVRHADPACREVLAELAERYPPGRTNLSGVPAVLREGTTVFRPEIGPGEIEGAAQDARHLELLRTLDPRSAIMVPIWLEGQVGGAITLARTAASPAYTQADATMAEELASWAAQALTNARIYQATRHARTQAERAAEQIATLQRLTAALAQALTPAAVADVVVEHGIAAAGAYGGSLVARGAQADRLDVLAVAGYPTGTWESRAPIDLTADLPIVEAARTGEPIWLPTHAAYAARYPQMAAQTQTSTVALAAIPLSLGGRVLGALGLSFDTPQIFDAGARDFLLAIALQCAQALERARLYIDSQAQAARFAVLAEAAQAFAARSRDLPALQDLLCARAAAHVGDLALLAMRSDDGGQVAVAAIGHRDSDTLAALRPLLVGARYAADTNLYAAALDGQPLHRAGLAQAELWAALGAPAPPAYAHADTFDLLVVPLRAQGQVFGALGTLRAAAGRPYRDSDLALLQNLADRAALAIDNARLYAREQRARAEAEAAVQLRDTFLSVASHELKTPMTALLGQAQLIQRRDAREQQLSDRDRRSVAIIIAQIQRLNRLTMALLDTTRIQQGRLEIRRAPCDLIALLQHILDDVEPTLSQHRIAYMRPPGDLTIMGDALRLEQVVLNLLENAVKYSPQGGQIVVELVREGDEARLSVSDSGIGMPAADIPHLFTRFYRASNAAGSYISGMGIGLFVIREIVSLHGGRVGVTSEEGVGSTFSVWLPLAKARAASGSEVAACQPDTRSAEHGG